MYDSCKELRHNDAIMAMSPPIYVAFQISLGPLPVKWGACMPAVCYDPIYSMLNTSVTTALGSPLVPLVGDDLADASMNNWKAILMIFIACFLGLLAIIGIIF